MLALALASGNGDGGKTHVAHVAVSDGPEQLDAVLEEMTFARLEQVVQFRAVSAWFWRFKREGKRAARSLTDDKVDVWKGGAYARCSGHEEIDALAIRQARNDDDVDCSRSGEVLKRVEGRLTGFQRLWLRRWGKLLSDERVRDRVYARSHDRHRGVLFRRLEQLTS